jgi:hypothetical protein
MNKYLMMVAMTALVVVALINAASKEKASWGEVETKILVPDALPTNMVTTMDNTEEITFKCRKEVTTNKDNVDKPFQPDSVKSNE